MTPFGAKLRAMRRDRGLTLKEMAADLEISAAYLSALEHGRRGRPTWFLVQAIIRYFAVIWDEAEELERLAKLSHPKVVVDTTALSPKATELANRLAENIHRLDDQALDRMAALLDTTSA